MMMILSVLQPELSRFKLTVEEGDGRIAARLTQAGRDQIRFTLTNS